MIIKCQEDVTAAVLAEIQRADDPRFAEIVSSLDGSWITLGYTFELDPGEPKLPRPPITHKFQGPRPEIERLVRA